MASFCVAAGGQASRFGSDKRFAYFRGHSFIEIILCKGIELGWPILLSVQEEEQARAVLDSLPPAVRTDIRVVTDIPGTAGPIAGLCATLRAAHTPYVFFAAVDLPLLDHRLAIDLVRVGNEGGYHIVVPRTARRIEPMAAVYSRSCLPDLDVYVASRKNSLQGFIRSLPPNRVLCYVPRPGERAQFHNVNRPEDLDRIEMAPEVAEQVSPTPAARVQVRFYGRARDLAGIETDDVDLPSDPSVGEFRKALYERFPALSPFGQRLAVAVVDRAAQSRGSSGDGAPASVVSDAHYLASGDEVLVLPPVTGG
ncbi:MAG: NTP transferase domain-containing protein [Nitrospirae bacterium]|nr:NTP transferase domain-containing protein [Nitrospirota bacterium]